MIDIETLGNGKHACIAQIGACSFDKTKTFKVNVDARDASRMGCDIDADTVYWWLQQSEAARQSICAPGVPICDALNQLNDFLSDADEVWSHATFDFVIVTNTMKDLNIKPKFSYRTARDIRTLVALAKIDPFKNRNGVHHDALDDCLYQVDYCSEAMAKLEVSK